MSFPMKAVSEFVRNSSDPWPPHDVIPSEVNPTATMSVSPEDAITPPPDEDRNLGVVIGAVVGGVIVTVLLAACFYWYCYRRRRQLSEKAISQHALYRHTIKDHPSTVYSVEKDVRPIQATHVASERQLRYSGEPAVSSLPASGRSVSYDCLGEGAQAWQSLRNSVASDTGYYVSESLSTTELSRSVGQAQGFLQDSPDGTPERSLSSDHIGTGRWPGVSRRPGSKASSLGRDSGLGGSQETCLSYQTDLKASLSNFSMSSTEAGYESDSYSERPRSLPPFYGKSPLAEIQKVSDLPVKSIYPNLASLDENANESDVQKNIKNLRDKFYTIRDQSGACDEKGQHTLMGTPNFVIGILDTEGGHLQLSDGSATLAIPKDALKFPQEVHLYAYYENACIDGKSYLRRVIECGPDGLAFKKPVCLSFIPKLIPCGDDESEADVKLKVVYKNFEPENWRSLKKKESFFHAQEEFVSIHVDHFTRFTVEPASSFVNLAGGGATGTASAQHNLGTQSRKFYVSVYVGPAAAGVTQYRVCFIEKDKDKLRTHNNHMATGGFRPAVASPKPFSVTSQGHDVRIEIPSLHGCVFKSPSKKHVVPMDEFDDETVEDIGPPQRDFLLGLTKANSEGLFEVAVFQENVHDKVLTFCISMNQNNLKEKLSAEGNELTHRDVMDFLAGSSLVKYQPNVCFPKNMKLDICTVVEGSRTHGWLRLAEEARIPGNKSSWLESYVRQKQDTPCYVVLDFIEAQLISKDIGIGEACDQLARMLERAGFEVAADYCKSWKTMLVKQSKHRSPHKEKGGRMRRDEYTNLSPSREELGTILEENNLSREGQDGRRSQRRENDPSPRHPLNMRLALGQEPLPNGVVGYVDRQYSSDVSPTVFLDGFNDDGSVTSLPSPNQNAFTISRGYDSTPLSTSRRPNKKLVKANREKSGRNDSGIGSEIASSPVESEGERSSHI